MFFREPGSFGAGGHLRGGREAGRSALSLGFADQFPNERSKDGSGDAPHTEDPDLGPAPPRSLMS